MSVRKRQNQQTLVAFHVESPDLEKAADAMGKAAQGQLLDAVAARLRPEKDTLAAKVRLAVMRIPSWNLYGTGLRMRIAANVEARAWTNPERAGIRIEVNPSGIGGLAAAMDSEQKRKVPGHGYVYAFRHPVFGNRERWVNQAAYPYFRRTLRNQKKVTDAAVKAAIDDVIEKVARANQ